MTLILVKYAEDFGRMGGLDAVFVTTPEYLSELRAFRRVHFGEVLGKHSDIVGNMTDDTLSVVSVDQDFIEKLLDVFKLNWRGFPGLGDKCDWYGIKRSHYISGDNPFDNIMGEDWDEFYQDEDEEDE